MACETVNYLKLVNCSFYLAERDANGKPGKLQSLGEASMFEYSTQAEYAEHFNSAGRFKVRSTRFARQITASAKIRLHEATLQNLAFLSFGDLIEEAGDTVTAEPFPRTGIVAGDKDLLPGFPAQVTSVTITDSAGSPATLATPAKYTLDADNGIITWVDVGGYTQPFKATYTYPDRDISSFARNAAADAEYWLVVTGENAARNFEKTRLILFRVQLAPTTIQLVDTDSNEAAGAYEMDIIPLEDLCRAASDADPFGRYGFQERIA